MNRKQIIDSIDAEINRLTEARQLLVGSSPLTKVVTPIRRVLSEDARKRIADAQKRRWAKTRAANKKAA